MPTESDTTSPLPPSNTSSMEKNGGNKLSTATYDPTPYIQRERVTRPAPPKPSVNPLQFVQIKPCSLYQSAQEQLKKAEEVKKVKEIKKEEPEDWQSNLDNWKSSRRKRVEHIIDRVVEVKKLEMEEHDRTRKKSKTFSEMLEERGSRRKLSTLAVYNEDEPNDLSDLGIGTSSASGKSSLSEDCDNQSVMSDTGDNGKLYDVENNTNQHECLANRDYISSPGYDTSTSTAPASTPDPCEYTYEGAIQDYKTRVSKAQTGYYNNGTRSTDTNSYSKDSTPERTISEHIAPRRTFNSKIEDRLLSFEGKGVNDNSESNNSKKDLPKINILKRRELFEKENAASKDVNGQKRFSEDFSNSKSIRERLSSLEKSTVETKKQNRLSGDINNIKDRLQSLEKQTIPTAERHPKIEVPVMSLKDRLSSLQNVTVKEEVKKPVPLIGEHDLEMLRREDYEKQNALKRDASENENLNSSQEILNIHDESNVDTDREDSGIHTTDVSCSVSQTDEQPELVNEDTHHEINDDGLCTNPSESLREQPSAKSTLAKGQGTLPKNLEDSSMYSEMSIDQETSVSLSLSESPTASIQTVIFNDKLTSDTEDVGIKSNALSQHMVKGTLGLSSNVSCSISPVTSSSNSVSLVEQKRFSGNKNENKHVVSPNKKAELKISSMPKVSDGNRHVVYDSKLRMSSKKEQLDSKAMEEVVKKCQKYLDTSEAIVSQTASFELPETQVEPSKFMNKLEISSPESPGKVVQDNNTKSDVVKANSSKDLEKVTEAKSEATTVVSPQASETVILRNRSLERKPNSNTKKNNDRHTVIEICEKADVRDMPKAANIPTPFFDINLNGKCDSPSETHNVLNLTKESEKETNKNSRPDNLKNGVIVAKFEVVETTIKVTSSNDSSPKSPTSSTAAEPTSPTYNPKTHPTAKPKNIFDFLKKNFTPSPEEEQLTSAVSMDNSKFYVPLKEAETPNEVNIEITRTVITEKIVEETESLDPELNITSEISQLLDEELSKFTVTEDTKL